MSDKVVEQIIKRDEALKKKQLIDFQTRIKDGEVLKAFELKAYKDLMNELKFANEEIEKKEDKNNYLTAREAAEFIEVSLQTIRSTKKLRPNPGGLYHINDVIIYRCERRAKNIHNKEIKRKNIDRCVKESKKKWYGDIESSDHLDIQTKGDLTNDEGVANKDTLEEQLILERILKIRFQNQQAAGNLVPIEDIKKAWKTRYLDLRTGLNALKNRFKNVLKDADRTDFDEIIDTEIDELFINFNRTGKFTKKEDKRNGDNAQ